MSYDLWKTTPPDWMWEEVEQTPEDHAELWLDDTWSDEWLEAFEEHNGLRAASGPDAPAGNRFTVREPAQS